MARFPRPKFADLLASYRTDSSSVHPCAVIDPTVGGVNTCACRMSEALVLTNHLAADRAAIGKLGTGKGDGLGYLLGKYGYGTTANTGRLCPHGIGRGAQDVGAFLKHHWGNRSAGWAAQESGSSPADIQGKKGVIVFIKIPGFSGQGHVDLWNDTAVVGHDYWNSKLIWLWSLE
ncbi:MAG: T6SS effector amidase Tae4 family protein [Minicystis sp.]